MDTGTVPCRTAPHRHCLTKSTPKRKGAPGQAAIKCRVWTTHVPYNFWPREQSSNQTSPAPHVSQCGIDPHAERCETTERRSQREEEETVRERIQRPAGRQTGSLQTVPVRRGDGCVTANQPKLRPPCLRTCVPLANFASSTP